ncbi:RmlC-like cupin domain-containing protein [Ilyonectria sp. MPI-CAGE-AT-0026]|nr:RmlC-like cupin domain-containing protein [Ilyonectria sp. MPI-CAGE-AT-0026]
MPDSKIISSSSTKVTQVTETFTGQVLSNIMHLDKDAGIASVTFTPCARTHWHTHVGGQMIHVLSGSGWICDKGGKARRIRAGDTIWASPGTTHWHGADEESVMTHLVMVTGETKWHASVTDIEYREREL